MAPSEFSLLCFLIDCLRKVLVLTLGALLKWGMKYEGMNMGDGKYRFNKPRKYSIALDFYDNPILLKHHGVPEERVAGTASDKPTQCFLHAEGDTCVLLEVTQPVSIG